MFDLPDAVQNTSIRENSDVDVGNEDVVEATLLLVAKERVWHPHFCWVGQCEVVQFSCTDENNLIMLRLQTWEPFNINHFSGNPFCILSLFAC